MAEPGSAPWAAASTAPAAGLRACVRACVRAGVRSGKGRPWRPRNRCPSPWRPRARLARPRQGRCDAGTLEGGGEGRRKRTGSKARPCPHMGVSACWGAPGRKGVGSARSRARARTRPRRGVAVTSGTTRHTTATRNKQASERARVDEGSGSCKKRSQPGTKAGFTSGGAAARGNSAFHLGSKAGASTWGGKRLSSPWWPRADVQARR
jgi:hypothetical protein